MDLHFKTHSHFFYQIGFQPARVKDYTHLFILAIVDPRVIGDKPRWYSHYVEPHYFQVGIILMHHQVSPFRYLDGGKIAQNAQNYKFWVVVGGNGFSFLSNFD